MVKRRTVMFAVLAAVVAIAAGCGSSSGDSSGGGSTPASSTGPVNLTMWWWGEQEAAGAKSWLAQTGRAVREEAPEHQDQDRAADDGRPDARRSRRQRRPRRARTSSTSGAASGRSTMPGTATRSRCPTTSPKIRARALPERQGGHVRAARCGRRRGTCSPRSPSSTARTSSRRRASPSPTTWDALLKACDTLNAKGITPIAGGVKDGWFGGWLFSIIGSQGITSISDVLDATTGEGEVHRPEARRLVDAAAGDAATTSAGTTTSTRWSSTRPSSAWSPGRRR